MNTRIVRDVTGSTLIDPGAIGKVTGTHPILGWPVVYFPHGTFGPHAEFAIRPDQLVDVAPEDVPTNLRVALGV